MYCLISVEASDAFFFYKLRKTARKIDLWEHFVGDYEVDNETDQPMSEKHKDVGNPWWMIVLEFENVPAYSTRWENVKD